MEEREIRRILDTVPDMRDDDPAVWYRTWPPEEKLRWLQDGRRLHDLLPPEIRASHDRLRRG
jgi:hypothetical protein